MSTGERFLPIYILIMEWSIDVHVGIDAIMAFCKEIAFRNIAFGILYRFSIL